MVAKPDIFDAKTRIEAALWEFFQRRGEARVIVAVNDYGHALVASHGIEGRDRDEVREQIREFLKNEKIIPPAELAYLHRIEVLTRNEFDARYFSSESRNSSAEGITLEGLPKGAIDG